MENSKEILEALAEIEEYFEQRADAEYFFDRPAPVPNVEHTLLNKVVLIRRALSRPALRPHYVTFGQVHSHTINGLTLDSECVARFQATTPAAGRAATFELFGEKFCFEYHDTAFPQDSIQHYPRGFVDLPLRAGLPR